MKNLTKLGVASALISVSLLFCACGSEDKREIALQKKVKEMYNAQLLSFEEAKKESSLKDLKDNECLKKPHDNIKENYNHYRFIKDSGGNIQIIRISDKISGATDDSFLISKAYLTLDELKAKYSECFN